jgi:hypothetical protein
MLYQLDVIDKHRQLLLTTVAIPATSWSPSPYFRPEDLRFDYSVRRVSEVLEHKQAAPNYLREAEPQTDTKSAHPCDGIIPQG